MKDTAPTETTTKREPIDEPRLTALRTARHASHDAPPANQDPNIAGSPQRCSSRSLEGPRRREVASDVVGGAATVRFNPSRDRIRVPALASLVSCSQSTISPRSTSPCSFSDWTIIAAACRTSARCASAQVAAPPKSSAKLRQRSRYRRAAAVRPSTFASRSFPLVMRLRSVRDRSAPAWVADNDSSKFWAKDTRVLPLDYAHD
jgi:hypothetical protein